MTRLGFTGTRKGMTEAQRHAIIFILDWLVPTEVHHGDCVGADAEFHKLAKDRGLRVVVHPPDKSDHRAGLLGDENRHPRPYLHRNRDIVFDSDVMIACPKEDAEPDKTGRGQGTWYTTKLARTMGRQLFVIFPDGSVDETEVT